MSSSLLSVRDTKTNEPKAPPSHSSSPPERDRTNSKIQSGKRIIETYAKEGKAKEKKLMNSVGEDGGSQDRDDKPTILFGL